MRLFRVETSSFGSYDEITIVWAESPENAVDLVLNEIVERHKEDALADAVCVGELVTFTVFEDSQGGIVGGPTSSDRKCLAQIIQEQMFMIEHGEFGRTIV